jgi:hypothetical protein
LLAVKRAQEPLVCFRLQPPQNESARWAQPGQSDRDEPADRGLGRQAAGRCVSFKITLATTRDDATEETHMADQPPYGDTGGDTGEAPRRGSTTAYPGTPRWVKVFGIILLVLVLLVVVIMATGVGGGHGPGRHMPSGSTGDHTPLVAHGAQRP